MEMTRRERLEALLEGLRVDRTPGCTYGMDRYSQPWAINEPSYADILNYSDQYDHIFAYVCSYYASFSNTDVLRLPDPGMVDEQVRREAGSTVREITVRAPRGPLTCTSRETDTTHTVWVTEHLIKTDEDMAAFVELPFEPKAPTTDEIKTQRLAVGDRGILEFQVPTSLCLVCENMRYEDFMVRTLTAPKKLLALIERCQELVEEWLTAALENGAGPCLRLFGAEYAAPPMLPPSFFEEAVAPFDKRLVEIIHDHGAYARYHCHGPIRQILDYVLEMEVDLLDPCEAPPNGDISLSELADIAGDELILMGNIQAHDMETLMPADIDRLVAKTLEEVGGRCRHILLPTASPIELPLRKQVSDNFKQFLDSAWARG
jgi:hypothetical protein